MATGKLKTGRNDDWQLEESVGTVSPAALKPACVTLMKVWIDLWPEFSHEKLEGHFSI